MYYRSGLEQYNGQQGYCVDEEYEDGIGAGRQLSFIAVGSQGTPPGWWDRFVKFMTEGGKDSENYKRYMADRKAN